MEENSDKRKASQSSDIGRSSTEYISPGGVSMLDISTRLRITEAELTIVRREVSELVAERNTLEAQSRRYQESWKFTLQQLGRTIEQRNELMAQTAERVNNKSSSSIKADKSPETTKKKLKAQVLKNELEACQQNLESQIKVAQQLEDERDKANDDFEFAKAQLSTVLIQHQDLISACAEVARERDKALSEARMLREELNRYDSELHDMVNDLDITDNESEGRDKVLKQQIKLLREEREHSQHTYTQMLDQYKRQLNKANMDRKHTVASADAMRALLQRRLEAAQSENNELRQELKTAADVINQLKEQLAHYRISQQQQQQGYQGYDAPPPLSDAPSDSQTPQTFLRPGPSRSLHTLSQDTGISLYTSEASLTSSLSTPSPSQNPELISPSNSSSYRVSSARTRRHFVPTASPFPEEPHDHSTDDDGEGSSWI